MAPQIHPGTSKIMPKCPTPIDGTHFSDHRGSKVEPWGLRLPRGVATVSPQAPPSSKKQPFWMPDGTLATLLGFIFYIFCSHCFAIMLPAAPSPPPSTNPSTLRPSNPSTKLRYRKGPAECAERLNKDPCQTRPRSGTPQLSLMSSCDE